MTFSFLFKVGLGRLEWRYDSSVIELHEHVVTWNIALESPSTLHLTIQAALQSKKAREELRIINIHDPSTRKLFPKAEWYIFSPDLTTSPKKSSLKRFGHRPPDGPRPRQEGTVVHSRSAPALALGSVFSCILRIFDIGSSWNWRWNFQVLQNPLEDSLEINQEEIRAPRGRSSTGLPSHLQQSQDFVLHWLKLN